MRLSTSGSSTSIMHVVNILGSEHCHHETLMINVQLQIHVHVCRYILCYDTTLCKIWVP